MRKFRVRIATLLWLIVPIALTCGLIAHISTLKRHSGFQWDESLLRYANPPVPREFDGEMKYVWWDSDHENVISQTVDGRDIFPQFHRDGFDNCLHCFDLEIRFPDGGVKWDINHPQHYFNLAEGSALPPPHDKAFYSGYVQCVEELDALLTDFSDHELHQRLNLGRMDPRFSFFLIGFLCWSAITCWYWHRRRKIYQDTEDGCNLRAPLPHRFLGS